MLLLFVRVLGNDVLRFLLFLNKSAETEATRTYLLSTASQAIPVLQNYHDIICVIIITSDKTKTCESEPKGDWRSTSPLKGQIFMSSAGMLWQMALKYKVVKN